MQLPYWRRALLIYFLWTSIYLWGAGAPFADRARISTACELSEDCPNELLQRGICEGFAGLRTLAEYGDSRSLAYIGSAISHKDDCTNYCLTASRANANRRRAILWRIGGGSRLRLHRAGTSSRSATRITHAAVTYSAEANEFSGCRSRLCCISSGGSLADCATHCFTVLCLLRRPYRV